MNRITRKEDRFYNGKTCGGWKKLQQFENIEEEYEKYGIDLIPALKEMLVKIKAKTGRRYYD